MGTRDIADRLSGSALEQKARKARTMPEYDPQPLDTAAVALTPEQAALVEALAENAHDVWGRTRLRQGWRWGAKRDDDQKLHPNLVPYDALEDDDKDVDREMVAQVIKAALALGYRIEAPK